MYTATEIAGYATMQNELALTKKVKQSTMVYQHNDLVTAAYQLSIPAKRVLSMMLGIIGGARPTMSTDLLADEFDFITTVSVADYAAAFDVALPDASKEMLAGVTEMTTATVKIYDKAAVAAERDDCFTIYPWLNETNVENAHSERGKYTFHINSNLLGYVGRLEKSFTQYDFLKIGKLSFNQWRFYEQLAHHKNHGKKDGVNFGTWFTDAEFFKSDVFNLGASVKKKPAELKRRFLDMAIDAVNEGTDLFVEFTDTRKQWAFRIYSGDAANTRREAWRKDKAAAALKLKEEKRLARLRKQIEKHKAEATE